MSTALAPAPARTVEAGHRYYRSLGGARALFAYRGPQVLLVGPAGTGKSRGCLEKLNAAAMKYPGMRGLILRKTRESLTQSALVTFEEKVLPEGSPVKLHHETQEYRYPNGSVIVVAGLDKASKVMSTEFDLIYVQEATEITSTDKGALTTRLRNNVMPYQQLVMDCNPGAPDHWLKKECDDGVVRLIESRHEDNPSVTPEYLAVLDALTGYQYDRLRKGLWVAAEGMYFTEWDPAIHVIDPIPLPAEWPRWTCTDWGYADPFCTLWLCRAPDAARSIYVYREAYASGLRDPEQARLIRDKSAGDSARTIRHYGDPSMFNNREAAEKASIAKVYEANGVRLEPAANDRIAGWGAVRSALALTGTGRPRLQVFRNAAPNLVRTLPAMVRDPLDAEDVADKIKGEKTEDHAPDTLRYGLVMEMGLDAARAIAQALKTPQAITINTSGTKPPPSLAQAFGMTTKR